MARAELSRCPAEISLTATAKGAKIRFELCWVIQQERRTPVFTLWVNPALQALQSFVQWLADAFGNIGLDWLADLLNGIVWVM